ncbi:MAG: hypothetical protein D6762_00845 [Candidatus Neomarinimicrobiota bacterium]|nr:MAG: hypothetical protein D6762_00845 [Candidatus Neomarinimicrobiota bacterium]
MNTAAIETVRTPEDEAFLKRIAAKIHATGLITPAVFFLELAKPLSLIGAHAMVFFGPILNAFIQTDGYYRAAELFEEPDNVEFLIAELERLDREHNANKEG